MSAARRRVSPSRLACGVVTGLLAALLLPAAATAAEPGPPLTVPVEQLEQAVECDGGALAGRRTVLLIHGTGSTPEEAWSWNYARALPASGYGVCTVKLPDRAVGNFTVAAEYAVYAARRAYQVSGRKIAILGHSQGGLMNVWIAKFWPDVASHSTDILSLAGPMRGTALANSLCVVGACSPISWQMSMGSHVTNAATNAPLPTSTDFTSIGTLQDEIVFPQPTVSHLEGARNVMVQDLCPARIVDHGFLLSDAVGYQLVLDALEHDGPADPDRVGTAVCDTKLLPEVDPTTVASLVQTVLGLSEGLLNVRRWTLSEPPLPAYAAPYGG